MNKQIDISFDTDARQVLEAAAAINKRTYFFAI